MIYEISYDDDSNGDVPRGGEEGRNTGTRGLRRKREIDAAKYKRERESYLLLTARAERPLTIYILRINALLTNLALISTFSASLC